MISNKVLIVLIIFIVSSCQSRNDSLHYNKSKDPTFPGYSILERPLPDSRGVITYKDYQIIVATGTEKVKDIAERLSIDPERLASYNGVLPNYLPRKDEVLALPVKVSGDLVDTPSEWSQEGARQAITGSEGSDKKSLGTPDNPIRHRIEAGDTAYSIARLYNVSVTSLAKWNGLDANLKLITGRELIIPVTSVPSSYNNTSEKEIPESGNIVVKNNASSEISTESGENSSSSEDSSTTKIEAESELTIIAKPYLRPVEGKILRRYNPTATQEKNEGIDFYATPGTQVRATADGVVALISKPVGGLGKIILLKHDKSVISIYGRLRKLQVVKGDRVVKGQFIGEVENSFLNENSSGKDNYLHFELRKGTKSLDPEPLLQ